MKKKKQSFNEIFIKNFDKDREDFEKATKGLQEDLPIERKFRLID